MQQEASHADASTARAVRDAAGGQLAWVFASPAPHGRLRLTGDTGPAARPKETEALALVAARAAIDAERPVFLLDHAGGPLPDAMFLAVRIPFDDGRVGALVVAGGHDLAESRTAADAVVAVAAAQVPRLGRVRPE